ncbi:cytochrome C oxidase caa3-type, assembly factor [Bacillus sp. OxB-1]|uniref:cytochrome c oxidase assembly protein n=1 Tax=Bacillus sp. (strain OxB-1) TaxID=98228 RepID=UPI000581E121|nr:cytochrome c oxidase assembly protein [Bacillus sp. OxB-1]BAQ10643.1 cytochrome C oxidase caa3-type, assembly factor [Bacillus sp. OxB-1]
MPPEPSAWTFTDWFFGIPALLAIILYTAAVRASNRRGNLRPWPWHRTLFWLLGVLLSSVALVGPLAHTSHDDFVVHMVGHLLLGMLGPLLLALAAPMTLLLRTLPVRAARKISRLLKSPVARFYSHPIIASILNIGGLWLLYTTSLYEAMHHHLLLHIAIHIHVFTAGYLFTISLIYIDPVAHRLSYRYRTTVFIFALAGHGILSKFLYAYPPAGVPFEQARPGAMLMYYGGDAVDLILIILLFQQWYRSIRVPQLSNA